MFSKYAFMALLLVLIVHCWSCVDIPGGPSNDALDMRSQVRFIHAARGVDTIALFLSRDPDSTITTLTFESTTVSGADTIIERDTAKVTYRPRRHYRRFSVDFSSPLEVIRDGISDGVLQFGEATLYREIDAGDRKIQLLADASLVDTIVIQQVDSVIVGRRTNLTTGSSSKIDTSIGYRTFRFLPSSMGTQERIIADFRDPSLSINSNRKISVLLFHNDHATQNDVKDSGYVRYGLINYFRADERYTFVAPPDANTIGLKFVNASHNLGTKKVGFSGVDDANAAIPMTTKDSLSLGGISVAGSSDVYYNRPRGTYKIYAFKSGSAVPTDSMVNVVLAGGHRFTFAIVDVDSTFQLKKYDDD